MAANVVNISSEWSIKIDFILSEQRGRFVIYGKNHIFAF